MILFIGYLALFFAGFHIFTGIIGSLAESSDMGKVIDILRNAALFLIVAIIAFSH